jgi:hypothetical protein
VNLFLILNFNKALIGEFLAGFTRSGRVSSPEIYTGTPAKPAGAGQHQCRCLRGYGRCHLRIFIQNLQNPGKQGYKHQPKNITLFSLAFTLANLSPVPIRNTPCKFPMNQSLNFPQNQTLLVITQLARVAFLYLNLQNSLETEDRLPPALLICDANFIAFFDPVKRPTILENFQRLIV